MILTIANISAVIGAAEFQAAVAAVGRQVAEDFQPEWDVTAYLRGTAVSLARKAPIQGNHDAIIYVGDSSQDPTTGVSGALAYHSETYADIPYGFVYLDICAAYGVTWTSALSHEVLELLADPNAVLTVTGPAPDGASGYVYYDLEVCDPTQGDSYTIDSVIVSNFVGRNYFGLTGGNGKSNYLNLPLAPFGVRPSGYVQYEVGGKTHQIQGENVTESQLAAKKLMKAGRRNERRRVRLSHTQPLALGKAFGAP
jgi:hypothetical protein